jgi:hypothetical protein
MKRSSRPSRTAELPESPHHQLKMYALAAGAAGVSAIALAPPADGKIIYTKTNTPILANKFYHLDVNHDGTPDFSILYGASNSGTRKFYVKRAAVAVRGWQITKGLYNSVVTTHPRSSGFAADLPPNAPVWRKRNFASHKHMAQCSFDRSTLRSNTGSVGPWRNVQSRYLGLKFSISGQIHYGWARLNVKLNKKCNFVVTLTGYAYETIPNKLIFTGHTRGPNGIGIEEPDAALTVPHPEPASLGALALGSPGLSIWRREQPTVAAG